MYEGLVVSSIRSESELPTMGTSQALQVAGLKYGLINPLVGVKCRAASAVKKPDTIMLCLNRNCASPKLF